MLAASAATSTSLVETFAVPSWPRDEEVFAARGRFLGDVPSSSDDASRGRFYDAATTQLKKRGV